VVEVRDEAPGSFETQQTAERAVSNYTRELGSVLGSIRPQNAASAQADIMKAIRGRIALLEKIAAMP
jgi:hypothetical protein